MQRRDEVPARLFANTSVEATCSQTHSQDLPAHRTHAPAEARRVFPVSAAARVIMPEAANATAKSVIAAAPMRALHCTKPHAPLSRSTCSW
jgi:hypothetical protein